MCKISSHLKLCTCGKRKILSSDSYWILYRWKKNDDIIVGDPIFLFIYFINPNDELSNQEKLLTVLNQENCFDFDWRFKHKDSLEINIKCPQENGQSVNLIYAFVYISGVWRSVEYDPFDLEKQEKKFGVIQM